MGGEVLGENPLAYVTQHTLLTPTGRDVSSISDRKLHYFSTSIGGRKDSLCPVITQPVEECHKSAMKSHHVTI